MLSRILFQGCHDVFGALALRVAEDSRRNGRDGDRLAIILLRHLQSLLNDLLQLLFFVFIPLKLESH